MYPMKEVPLSAQKYKRTNFDEEDTTSTCGTPTGITYDPAVSFKASARGWRKRSCLERFLLLLSFVLFTLVIILSILLKDQKLEIDQKSSDLCLTTACINIASSILTSIDLSVDPCKDFYEYACGGWLKSHTIPMGESRWGRFGLIGQENEVILHNCLEQPSNSTESIAEQKAILYYQSCMDMNGTIEKLGAQPLIDLINEYGGWNISSPSDLNFNVDNWNFQEQIQYIHHLGISAFFNIWVGEDEKNSSQNIIQLDQGGLGLDRIQYLNKSIETDETLSHYLDFMVALCDILGFENSTESKIQMIKVIEFEQKLANITMPKESRRDDMKLYHKKSLRELQDLSPFMNWEAYITNLFKVTDYEISDEEQIVIFAPEYFRKLTILLNEMESTDQGKFTLKNYMYWHVAKVFAFYLSKSFRNAEKKFNRALSGIEGSEEHWRICTSDTDSVLGFALAAMFIRQVFDGNRKEKAEEMIQDIKKAFIANLPNLEWMDEETRLAAMDKAKNVANKIGFPQFILDKKKLDERYAELDVNENEYFMNNVAHLKYTCKRNLDKLRKPPDKESWSLTPPSVNAYYAATKNEIVFPAGILRAPFYDRDFPRSINFGAMGVVVGHELTHGFDDIGREYDKYGNLRLWWNNGSITRFKERTQCMIDQYSDYKIHGEKINGIQTLGENIADNGGLKSSFNAYNARILKSGKDNLLPGLNFTHEQLFFISFAQVWCQNSKPQADHMALIEDPHSPAKYRVIGTLSNSKHFSKHFSCPNDSPMNPSIKCEVW